MIIVVIQSVDSEGGRSKNRRKFGEEVREQNSLHKTCRRAKAPGWVIVHVVVTESWGYLCQL
jgi:hypothetical protein